MPLHGAAQAFTISRNTAGKHLYDCIAAFVDDATCGDWCELTNEQRAQWCNAAQMLQIKGRAPDENVR